jgi:predicted Ser/Thr protein kinase
MHNSTYSQLFCIIEERAAPEHIESTTPRSANDLAELTKQHLRENLDAAWQLDYNDFYFLDQLGKGNSSMVYVGTYKEQKVALKVLRLENHQRDLEDFKKELEIMSLVKHPTIVNFYGASLEPKLVIALEYCSKGSLFHYLQDVSNPVRSWSIRPELLLFESNA